jgi:hypothetical protein
MTANRLSCLLPGTPDMLYNMPMTIKDTALQTIERLLKDASRHGIRMQVNFTGGVRMIGGIPYDLSTHYCGPQRLRG